MRISQSSLSLLLFVLMPTVSHTSLIGFEGFAYPDSWDSTTYSWGEHTQASQTLNMYRDRSADPGAGFPQQAWLEECVAVQDSSGRAYVHAQEFLTARGYKTSDIASLDERPYLYPVQDVHAQLLGNRPLKYPGSPIINTVFLEAPAALSSSDIDFFGRVVGNGGTLVGPAWPDYGFLIKDISPSGHKSPSPISEPSMMLILGLGLFGLARMFGKSQNMMNH